ncbi:ABC transporter permease [Ensifer sp. T173]|uniref:ABC transporter permease n=1 Tax=Ensifer canadensis TaxID=555315 RepID=A0AAW4FME8_9HYPH|nr:ABC transporter permease [Ensifer canadensis]MBM3092431.1 ABC transporter permease [Ensifer canadensis]UBI74002.1 ABC transporter permease [Ensifer canadensis]
MSGSSNFIRSIGGASGAGRALLLAALIVAFIAFVPNFTSSNNIYALFQTFALLGLVTLGLSLTMISGEFDLSVGAMVAVGGLITLKMGESSALTGVLFAVSFGAVIGFLNAAIFWRLNISSLVVTVGTMMALSGLAYWLADGRVVSSDNFDAGEFLDDPVFAILSVRSIITFVAFALVFALLRYTRSGRDIIVTGSKRRVAVAAGARVGLSLGIVFCLSGICAALAGSLLSLSLATASAQMGANIMIQAASAAILGGVALAGGVGGAGGVLVGVFILATLNNGMSLLGANAAAILLTNGLVLLAVVLADGHLVRRLLADAKDRRARQLYASGS